MHRGKDRKEEKYKEKEAKQILLVPTNYEYPISRLVSVFLKQVCGAH
jgi:hypothetical protein